MATNFLLNTFNEKSITERENLGKTSDKLREPGCHLATIKDMYITETDSWSKVDVNFTTDKGTVNISEFNSTPKDDTTEAVAKAEAANNRLQNSLARMFKAAGLKDMATAAAGATESKDAKGRTTIVFTKPTGKKLYITTHIEIQSDKDGIKAYANCVIDTFKYLDKTGLNGMKIDSREAFDTAAKDRREIYFRDDKNPACIAKLAQLNEQAMGGTSAAPAAPANPGTGMPTGVPAAPISDEDI